MEYEVAIDRSSEIITVDGVSSTQAAEHRALQLFRQAYGDNPCDYDWWVGEVSSTMDGAFEVIIDRASFVLTCEADNVEAAKDLVVADYLSRYKFDPCEWWVADVFVVNPDKDQILLGEKLKRKFPDVDFRLDVKTGMWVAEKSEHVELLRGIFDYYLTNYLINWRTLLGVNNLVVDGHSCESWFGFLID